MDMLQKILNIRYDEIVYNCYNEREFKKFQPNFHFVRRGKFWGMISKDGDEIIPLAYSRIDFVDDEFVMVWEKAWLGERGYSVEVTYGPVDFEVSDTIDIEDEWSSTAMCGLYDTKGEKWLDTIFHSIKKLNGFFIAEKYDNSRIPSRHYFLRKKTEEQLSEFYVFKSNILMVDPADRSHLDLYNAEYEYQYFRDLNICDHHCEVLGSNLLWGYTDKVFNELFPCIIDELLKYKDGKRKVKINGEEYFLDEINWVLYDLNGEIIRNHGELGKSHMPF